MKTDTEKTEGSRGSAVQKTPPKKNRFYEERMTSGAAAALEQFLCGGSGMSGCEGMMRREDCG